MCRHTVRWVFTLPDDFVWHDGPEVKTDASFQDKTGVVRLILRPPRTVIVTSGYAWDGCTPKFCLLDLQIGTPDGAIDSRTKQRKTYYASLVHDSLYQFLLDGLPFSRVQADACFLNLMRETNFAWRYVYWLAVRALGWLFVAQHRFIRKNRGVKVEAAV